MVKRLLSKWHAISSREKRITVSTLITLSRIVLTPVIIALMCADRWTMAFFIFVLAALTDVIDGAVARGLREQTVLGACLDPIADKIWLFSCFSALAFIRTPFFIIPHWFVLAVLCKELILVLGIIIVYMYAGYVHIAPTRLGKVTTFVQICFIMWIFMCYFLHWNPVKTYVFLLVLLFCMIGVTLVQYIRIGMRIIRKL